MKNLSSCWLQCTTLEHEPLDYIKKGQDLLKQYDSNLSKFFTVLLTQKNIEKEKAAIIEDSSDENRRS